MFESAKLNTKKFYFQIMIYYMRKFQVLLLALIFKLQTLEQRLRMGKVLDPKQERLSE